MTDQLHRTTTLLTLIALAGALASCGAEVPPADDTGTSSETDTQTTTAVDAGGNPTDTATADEDAPGEDDTSEPDSAPDGGSDAADDDTSTDEDTAEDTADAAATDGGASDAGETSDSADAGDSATTDASAACQAKTDCQQPATGCLDNACVAGSCTLQPRSDGEPCSDGNPCTAKAACTGGTCTVTAPVNCDDALPCTTDACDPKTGTCKHTNAPAGGACDDGDACTAGTTCGDNGVCGGGANNCGCKDFADCQVYDDGDPCNGTLYCDLNLPKPICKVIPGSAVVCDTSLDTACATTECLAATGSCVSIAKAAGLACDDGNPCTKGDACADGACTAAANTCVCSKDADCGIYDDGNACNGKLYCDKSGAAPACKVNPATIIVCNKAAGVCQKSACDPKVGACQVTNLPDGTPCEDGSEKTVGDTCGQGQCQAGTDTASCKNDVDCAKWEDGDACNGTLFCNKAEGTCVLNPKTVVVCPSVDNTACAVNTCQAKTGLCAMVAASDGKACDDGNACTAGDSCQKGLCAPSANTCECTGNADCNAKEDGNLCNGTLFCDIKSGKCVLNPSTVVSCPASTDQPCLKTACTPKTGACATEPVADGSACDDGNPCSEADGCQAGVCKGVKTCACSSDADCAAQEDGNVCNGTLYCNHKTGGCQVNPATIKTCPTVDDTACSKTACEPKTGACKLVATSNGVSCDADGNPCTKNDYCSDGVCKPGAMACACYVDADCKGTGKDNGKDNKCILGMMCDPTTFTCKPAKQVACDTAKDSPCSNSICDPADGVCKTAQQPPGTVCGESAICAGAQVCDKTGACVPGAASDCDDADACTKDACDPAKGCTFTALDEGPCDDGTVCTQADACAKGQCVGKSIDCNDNLPCTLDPCDPKTGCQHELPAKDGGPCDDNDACTKDEACKGKDCMGAKATCSDGNPCTKDLCDKTSGCVFPAEATGTTCDDTSACTQDDACAGGVCAGAAVSCDDSDACTADACDKTKGCTYKSAVGALCDDGDACTVGDKCNGLGNCTSNTKKICNDGNPCTIDSCDSAQGCQTTPTSSPCDDGSKCSTDDSCQSGTCQGKTISCEDANACTADSCDPATGCAHTSLDGKACDDNDACSEGDACTASACKGSAKNCSDDNSCTKDSCDGTASCVNTITHGVACDDALPCTEGDTCNQAVCSGKPTFWLLPWAASASVNDEFHAIIPRADGGAYAVGSAIVMTQTGTSARRTAMRVDKFGAKAWSYTFEESQSDSNFLAGAVLSNGWLIAVGWQDKWQLPWETDNKRDATIVLYDESGQVKGFETKSYAGDQTLTHAARMEDGSVGVCGVENTGSTTRGFYGRTKGGDPSFAHLFYVASPSGGGALSGAAAGASNALWCTGAAYGSPDKVWMTRFSSTGSVLTNKTLAMASGYGWLGQRLLVAKDGLVVAGLRTDNGVARAFVAGLPLAADKVTWFAVVEKDHSIARGVGSLGGGKYGLALSTSAPGDPIFAAAGSVGGAGTFGATFSYPGGGPAIGDAVFTPPGVWWMAGSVGGGAGQDSMVARASPFGQIGCKEAGLCAAKVFADCDDGEPCTVDACDGASGCSHAKVADGVACGSGLACKAGVCGP